VYHFSSSTPVGSLKPGMIFESAIQWVSTHWKPLVRRRKRPSSGLGALDLPHEILLMIISYLNNLSTASLALTCRSLRGICTPRQQNLNMILNMRNKVELLLFLEKDEPALYFCHFCRKLHHWYRTWINVMDDQSHIPLIFLCTAIRSRSLNYEPTFLCIHTWPTSPHT
jgi:hypothetical protein